MIIVEGHVVLSERVLREDGEVSANIWLNTDMKLAQGRVTRRRRLYKRPDGVSGSDYVDAIMLSKKDEIGHYAYFARRRNERGGLGRRCRRSFC